MGKYYIIVTESQICDNGHRIVILQIISFRVTVTTHDKVVT